MEETRSLAPVILFTYNRPEHTKRTMEALAANELASETDLYVFSDAAKKDADKEKVQEIRDYVKTVQGFRRVELTAREQNYGLAKNVIEGVTAIWLARTAMGSCSTQPGRGKLVLTLRRAWATMQPYSSTMVASTEVVPQSSAMM